MAAKITDAKMKKFLGSLDGDSKEIVEKVLSTVALQAETIDDLLWKLEIYEGGAEVRRRILSGVSLTKLAAKLTDVDVSGPTLEDVKNAVDKMQDDVQSAADAQGVFKTILSFALKVAPLVL